MNNTIFNLITIRLSVSRLILAVAIGAMLLSSVTAQFEEATGHDLWATAQTPVKYRLPFHPDRYNGIYNFADHGGVDWSGTTGDTYAGHEGTDFRLPVGTPILAGATGIPYETKNDCDDSGWIGNKCGGGFGNHVKLKHADGRVSIYAHMKKGTVIAASTTQAVQCGQQLGESASSGSSNAPHLHFEIWASASGTRSIDPYFGPGNPTSATGEWTSQPNAYPSGLVGAECDGAASTGYFGVTATPVTQTIAQGGSASFNIQVNSLDGFNGSVSLHGIDLPTGYDPWSTTMSPAVVAVSPGNPGNGVLTIGTNASTIAGTYTVRLKGISGNREDSENVQLTITAGQTAQSPILDGYSFQFPPLAGEPFHGTITGRRFVVGSTKAYFCMESTTICYEHPNSGMTIGTETLLPVDHVVLSEGRWQIFVHTPGGQSNRSAAFSVARPPNPVITSYSFTPSPQYAGQPFGGTVTGANFVNGSSQARVFFCGGVAGCLEHPPSLVNVTNAGSLTVSNVNLGPGPWKFYVRTGARQSETSAPFTVLPPSLSSYSLSPSSPTANGPFGGEVVGAGFVAGSTKLYACVNGSQTCYEHPASLATVVSSTRITFTDMNLGQGSYQLAVQVGAYWSNRTGVFTVGPPAAPTIGGRTLNESPMANDPFNGEVTGTGFVAGATKLYACVSGSPTCYEHPDSLTTVVSSTKVTFTNMNLGAGSYEFAVRVNGVWSSNRSTLFNVSAPPAPTITGYNWSSTPRAGQNFGGSVSGTGFVTGSGNTRVFFCVNGTSTCYEHGSTGINVTSSTAMTVSNVNLGPGSWQFYVQTSGGSSTKSWAFNITSYVSGTSWTTTPRAGVAFGGTVNGAGFAAGARVFFCVNNSSTCYEHPGAGIVVTSATKITVSGVSLGAGAWQVYVQTSAGQSNKSPAFTVSAAFAIEDGSSIRLGEVLFLSEPATFPTSSVF